MNDADKSRADYLSLMRQVEDLFYLEADLLDERRYESWLELLTDDIRYWMPMRKNVAFDDERGDITGDHDIAWIDDDKVNLAKRARQILTGIHWAEEPLSRASHVITNIRMPQPVAVLPEGGELATTCRFILYRNRVETETDLMVGRRHDTIRRVDGRLMIARRKIILDQTVLMAKNLTIFF